MLPSPDFSILYFSPFVYKCIYLRNWKSGKGKKIFWSSKWVGGGRSIDDRFIPHYRLLFDAEVSSQSFSSRGTNTDYKDIEIPDRKNAKLYICMKMFFVCSQIMYEKTRIVKEILWHIFDRVALGCIDYHLKEVTWLKN